MKNIREVARSKRHKRITMKLCGTHARPRLVIRRSLKNLFAQFVDDGKHVTIFSCSSVDKAIRTQEKSWGTLKAAGAFGELCARTAKEKGISKIVFDRAGYLYHGRIKAFADGLRKGGLEF